MKIPEALNGLVFVKVRNEYSSFIEESKSVRKNQQLPDISYEYIRTSNETALATPELRPTKNRELIRLGQVSQVKQRKVERNGIQGFLPIHMAIDLIQSYHRFWFFLLAFFFELYN